jgi:hypothetical protein
MDLKEQKEVLEQLSQAVDGFSRNIHNSLADVTERIYNSNGHSKCSCSDDFDDDDGENPFITSVQLLRKAKTTSTYTKALYKYFDGLIDDMRDEYEMDATATANILEDIAEVIYSIKEAYDEQAEED